MGAVAIPAAIVGGGLEAYGAIKTAQSQAELDRKKADITNQQADEIVQREQANELLRNSSAYRQKLAFGAAYASSGKEGTGIGSQLEIQRQADLQNIISKRDSDFQVSMLHQQAGIDTTLAKDTEEAGYLSAASSVLGAAGSAAKMSAKMPAPSTQGLPNFSGG